MLQSCYHSASGLPICSPTKQTASSRLLVRDNSQAIPSIFQTFFIFRGTSSQPTPQTDLDGQQVSSPKRHLALSRGPQTPPTFAFVSIHDGSRSKAPKSLDRPVRHAMGPWSRNPELHLAQAQAWIRCASWCSGPQGQMAQVHRSQGGRLQIRVPDAERHGKIFQPAPINTPRRSSHLSSGQPRHPTPQRPRHHFPRSKDHDPPDLQLRPDILLLRAELRRKLPRTLLLARQLRPCRAQQAQRHRTRRESDTSGLSHCARPGKARSGSCARASRWSYWQGAQRRQAAHQSRSEQGVEQEKVCGEGREQAVLREPVPQHVRECEFVDYAYDFRWSG
jgi:hypothetical protein